jgi:hypothetical protein
MCYVHNCHQLTVQLHNFSLKTPDNIPWVSRNVVPGSPVEESCEALGSPGSPGSPCGRTSRRLDAYDGPFQHGEPGRRMNASSGPVWYAFSTITSLGPGLR